MKNFPKASFDSVCRAGALLVAGFLTFSACNNAPDRAAPKAEPTGRAAGPAANDLVSRFRALDDSKSSVTRMRVRIEEEGSPARSIQMVIYRRREADGGQKMVMDFSAFPDERDRSALIAFSPRGEAEATRYIQSNNSFVTTTTVTGEDSLFGMTLQELADGQTEKYDYTLLGEETVGSTPAYEVEGKLKQGAESKFPRLVMALSKDNATLRVAEFYGSHNELERRLTVTELEEIGGHWTRRRWTIDNLARKKKLDFEALDVKYDSNLNDSIFSKDNLKKISSR